MEDQLIESLDDLVSQCMDLKKLPDDEITLKPSFASITHKDMRTQDITISNNSSKIEHDELRGAVVDVFVRGAKGLGRGSEGIENIADFQADRKGMCASIKEELDTAIKKAGDDYFKRKGKALLSAEPNIFLKLSEEEVVNHIEPEPDRYALYISEKKKRRIDSLSKTFSKIVRENEAIQKMQIEINASDLVRRFANSEGTKIMSHRFTGRCRLYMTVRTEDGRIIEHVDDLFHTKDPDKIRRFDQYLIQKVINSKISHANALAKTTPLGTGECPAIFDGYFSETFFHELAHLFSGQYIYTKESSMFAGKLGKPIMNAKISIIDDPIGKKYFGSDDYDEEGVKTKKLTLVKDGVLVNYLLDRVSAGMLGTNSEGKARSGWVVNEDDETEEMLVGTPEPRSFNTIVQPARLVKEEKLLRTMIEHCKKYGYEFGLLVMGNSLGGIDPKTGNFELKPTRFYKIHASGESELTSGSYLTGNPLYILSQIALCGGKYRTSSGICGADSGPVPEGGRAPSTFVKTIAYQDDSGDRLTKKLFSKLD
jgi:TldD protein